MTTKRRPEDYLHLGDKLLRRGRVKTAAAVYVRCADAWIAETFLDTARGCAQSDPIKALRALAEAERLVGPTDQGRSLTAAAYESLGEREIAQRFRLAVATVAD